MNIVPLYADLRRAASIDITGCMHDSTLSVYAGHKKHFQFDSGHQQATPLLNLDYFPSIPPKWND